MPVGCRWLMAIAPAAAVCGSLAEGPAAHAATMPVKPAIERQSRAVTNSRAERRLQTAASRARNASAARKLVDPLEALERRLNEAATTVSRSRATTASGRTARGDWVRGVRGDARAIGQIVIAFRDLERNDKSGARRELV